MRVSRGSPRPPYPPPCPADERFIVKRRVAINTAFRLCADKEGMVTWVRRAARTCARHPPAPADVGAPSGYGRRRADAGERHADAVAVREPLRARVPAAQGAAVPALRAHVVTAWLCAQSSVTYPASTLVLVRPRARGPLPVCALAPLAHVWRRRPWVRRARCSAALGPDGPSSSSSSRARRPLSAAPQRNRTGSNAMAAPLSTMVGAGRGRGSGGPRRR